MSPFEQNKITKGARWFSVAVMMAVLFFAPSWMHAAVQGETGSNFTLSASAGYVSMPDGASIYSWGYGGSTGQMQLPGPTLIVNQGTPVTVTLHNNLPIAAGNTSIVFPGQQVTAAGGVSGLLTNEAQPGGTVTYTFTATRPGTFLYHSGTRTDLQVEMGLYGALIVLPTTSTGCTRGSYSLAASAYNDLPGAAVNPSCYDREYLFVLSEMQIEIHQDVEAQASGLGPIEVAMEPYTPEYWMINGRGAPDTMELPNMGAMPHQPYNSMPRMHPGEKVLLRIVGAGRQMHTFHTHGNHVRVLARDGQLLVSPTNPAKLEAKQEFSVPTLPGQTVDGTFEWTGKDLGWDLYGHTAADGIACTPNGEGYDITTKEWCADHRRPIPVLLPNPNVLMNGGFYSGSPFLGDLVQVPPGQGGLNPNAGFTYMWHSHVERELTNGNVFPGGLMTMLVVEPPTAPINELQ
jgi:FtsP/CotA-like multicopper oxidase with cupredoxin domain